jgi:hypothetical protein
MTTPAQPDPKWKRFEKIIHAMHQQLAPAGAIVTPDDKVSPLSESKRRAQSVLGSMANP